MSGSKTCSLYRCKCDATPGLHSHLNTLENTFTKGENSMLKKILQCCFLFLLVIVMVCFNYYYYRFSYPSSTFYVIIILCSVMHLFAKSALNSKHLNILAFTCIIIWTIFIPHYTIFSAQNILLNNYPTIKNVDFDCLISSTSTTTFIPYKNYVFKIKDVDDKRIIFNVNSGVHSIIDW